MSQTEPHHRTHDAGRNSGNQLLKALMTGHTIRTTLTTMKAAAAQQPFAWAARSDERDGSSRPFLKWAGGKRQLLPQLLRYVPPGFNRYYEPFIGGAALYFALRPKQAILGDFNARLARSYLGVRNDVESVIRLLRSYPHSRAFFDAFRRQQIDTGADADVAAWLIYLNRTAYNGLYRVNRANEFNTPFGSYGNPTICDPDLLRTCAAALQNAEILIGDFETTVSGAQNGDFVYFDPPYLPLSTFSDFTRYTNTPFNEKDQIRLRDVARTLKQRGVAVLLSNSSAPRVRELYGEGFEMIEVEASRAVNCKAEKRGKVTELLIR